MNKLFFLSLIILLTGCAEKAADSYLTPEKALSYFSAVEEICNRDNGQLWGTNLYGPLMFVERTSRRIIANFPDSEGLLKVKDGVYSGTYPKELIIFNAPVNFGGKIFAMVPLPLIEDEMRIKTRAIHGLFHCYQQSQGIQPALFNQRNMDEKEARLYLKLEWKALKKALTDEGNDRLLAIRDALVFRGAGRELYGKFAADGNHFETYEGLATFTYTKLCSETEAECKSMLIENLERIYSMPSYARSYGNIHGALYTALLYDAGQDIKKLNADTTDLAMLVKHIYKIDLPAVCRDVAGSLALGYDFDIIKKEEEERLAGIQERLHQLTSTFTEKNVVYMELESPSFDFEPEDIHPVDTLGTLYSSMRVSDSWGKLTVDKGGCLVSGNYKYLRITARGFKEDKNRVSGEGWNLILNDGWEFAEVDGNHFLRKIMPL